MSAHLDHVRRHNYAMHRPIGRRGKGARCAHYTGVRSQSRGSPSAATEYSTNRTPSSATGTALHRQNQYKAQMNAAFGTNHPLHQHRRLEDSDPVRPFAALCCISALEHLSDEEIAGALSKARSLLGPSAQVVFAVDQFIDADPFTSEIAAMASRNVSIGWLHEFGTDHVLSNLEDDLLSAELAQLAQLASFSL
jgi:hypothetical protein